MPRSADTIAIACSSGPLPPRGGEDDGGAGEEADPPGGDPDLVAAPLDDQGPRDAAGDRGDERGRDRECG